MSCRPFFMSKALKRGFLALMPATFMGLGTWQLCRHFEKSTLEEERGFAFSFPTRDIKCAESLFPAANGSSVRLFGSFESGGPYIYLGPRMEPACHHSDKGRALTRPLGYHLLRKFTLNGDASEVIVNLGWINRDAFANSDKNTVENLNKVSTCTSVPIPVVCTRRQTSMCIYLCTCVYAVCKDVPGHGSTCLCFVVHRRKCCVLGRHCR